MVRCLEKDKFLLYPRKFILRIDNRNLCFMKALSPPGRLVERLLFILSNYHFDIQHRKLSEILNVDYLSRDGCTGEASQEELEKEREIKDLTISSMHQQSNKRKLNENRITEGDLIKLATCGRFDVIINGCNCFCNTNAGFAKSIKTNFPEAFQADLQTIKEEKEKLGNYTAITIQRNGFKFTIVNAYTQYNYGGSGVKVDYDAIKNI